MDLSKLNEELNDDVIPEVNPADLPEQKGGGRTILYPGAYEMLLPLDFDAEIIDNGTRQLVQLNFRDAFAIVANPGGLKWSGRLTNRPYEQTVFQGKEKSKVLVNDLALLLKAVGFTGVLNTNKAYLAAIANHAGHAFLANVDWTAYCNPTKPKYQDGQKQEGTVGCGQRYALKAYTKNDGTKVMEFPKDEDGRWAERFACGCGNELWTSDNLTKIRAKK